MVKSGDRLIYDEIIVGGSGGSTSTDSPLKASLDSYSRPGYLGKSVTVAVDIPAHD